MITDLHRFNYILILIRSCTEYCKIYFYYIFFGFIIYFFTTRNCVLSLFFVDRCCYYAIMYAMPLSLAIYVGSFLHQFQSCFVFQYSYTDRKRNARILVKLYLSIDAVDKRFRSHYFITIILKYITFISTLIAFYLLTLQYIP